MRVAQAASLVLADKLSLSMLWTFTTIAERIQIALILGKPAQLPVANTSPLEAWKTLDKSQQRLVVRLSPLWVSEMLPAGDPPDAAVDTPRIRRPRRRARLGLKPGGSETPPAEPSPQMLLAERYC